jgi:hypothetical protein
MMRGRGQALLDFLSDLWAGDLVAWMFVGGIVLGLVIFFLVGIKIMRDKRRMDEEFKKKRRLGGRS